MKQDEKYIKMIVKLIMRHKSKAREVYCLLLVFFEKLYNFLIFHCHS